MSSFLTIVFVFAFLTSDLGTCSSEVVNSTRGGKVFSAFQIVSFPNIACVGSSSRNGTCFTSDECASKDGISGGSCAQGFGVCCIFSVGCGAIVSENCTYLVQSSTSSPTPDPCFFNICKASSNICRIRLDFATFSIAGPTVGTTVVGADETNGPVVGDCLTDTFSVSSPGNTASPVICGFNSGQHMIVDASNECNRAIFNFDGTGSTRQFDIKVTQYKCGDENGGPDGCLQYFTGNFGSVASYNFPTTASAIGDTTTHLSNQCYTICFRQELGKCGICFGTAIPGGAATMDQGSFGLSIPPAAALTGSQDLGCSNDYLQIPGAERDAASPNNFEVGTVGAIAHERICGRFFGFAAIAGVIGAANNDESICTQQRPFRVIFKTDADEMTGAASPETNEAEGFPGGIIGFLLNFALQDC